VAFHLPFWCSSSRGMVVNVVVNGEGCGLVGPSLAPNVASLDLVVSNYFVSLELVVVVGLGVR
jgi:hypothetical protein